MKKILLTFVALPFCLVACANPGADGPPPPVAQTNDKAKSDLDSKLDKANVTPDQRAQAQRDMNAKMQSTNALRQLSQQNGSR